jgi:branched-chain amino acid transport system ATP-binding protein
VASKRQPPKREPSKRRPPQGREPKAGSRENGGEADGRGLRASRELRTFQLPTARRAAPVPAIESASDVVLAAEAEALEASAAAPATAAAPAAPAWKPPSFGSQVGSAFGQFFQQVKLLARPSAVTGGEPIAPLFVILAISLFERLDNTSLAVLNPEIKDYFGLSLQGVLTVSTLVGVFNLLFALPAGYFADRWNRVKMVSAGAALSATFSVATGLAPNVPTLAVARFGSGVGQTLDSARLSLLSDYYPPSVRPAVFSFQRLAGQLAGFIAPALTGVLATVLFWQFPFFLYAVPGLVLAAYVFLRLKDPVRGAHERRAMGAAEDVALTAEKPPSWSESWRITMAVRTLRRIFLALPFLVGSLTVIAPLVAQFYFEEFGLSAAERGFLSSVEEPFAIVGLIVGGVVSIRFLRFRPGRIVTYVGLLAAFSGATIALTAVAPYLWLVVALQIIRAFLGSFLAPALLSLLTLVIPPRVRSFALSAGVVFAFPGVFLGPFAGYIGDHFGLRFGILVMVPVFMIGAFIIASAGLSVEADMRQAMAASMASHISRDSREKGQAKLLVVRDLDVHYDDVQILFNVDFQVDEGELVALLGTNGAGKSTLLRAISGLTPASNGAVFYDGEDITYLPANEHAARGIVFMPGGRSLFPTLSVEENLRLAGWMYRDDENYVRESTDRVLEYFPILRERSAEAAGNLSGGEQQMLALGQAFLSRPRLLMIDELSLGLAPTVVEQLLRIVRAIHELGTTIVLVEQSVNVALTVAHRAVFMEKGEVRFSGPTAELWERHDILRSVFLRGTSALGGSVSGSYAHARRPAAVEQRDVVFEVREIRKRFGGVTALQDVSFTLEEGRILGLIGPNGAGKTTLFDVISGFVPADEGRIILFGQELAGLTPDQRARLGLQRSFQDARLFPALTVNENIAVALERQVTAKSPTMAALHLPAVRKAEVTVARRVARLIELLNLGDYKDKFVRELSTGTRRIVDLACVMAADPKVVLLDEPSSGIAQTETEELGPLLLRVKYETGCSLLVIEHDMTLIRSISDELIALDLGAVVTRGTPDEVLDHPRVIESYLGTNEEAIRRTGQH